uniref:EF-hand domain-containing protein n=1 Tax=Plectus sambesii TaxID=2011161 RepID=A0A914VQX7_9BILA
MANSLPLVALMATVSILSPSISAQNWWESTDSPDSYEPSYYGSASISTSKSAAIFFENAGSGNNTALTLDDFLRTNSIYEQILAIEKARLALIDTNNDGKATEKERTTFLQKLKDNEKSQQLHQYQNYIDECDKGDGKMQALEFEEFLQDHLNLKPIENVTIAQVMKPFDTDNDGALSDAELYEFVYNKPTDQLEDYYDYNYSSSSSDSDYSSSSSDSSAYSSDYSSS